MVSFDVDEASRCSVRCAMWEAGARGDSQSAGLAMRLPVVVWPALHGNMHLFPAVTLPALFVRSHFRLFAQPRSQVEFAAAAQLSARAHHHVVQPDES
jgi:hypothetical protein